jgi:hypothetical protein
MSFIVKGSYSSVSANPVFHVRTEQIKMNHHFVTEQVAQKLLYIKIVSCDDQL